VEEIGDGQQAMTNEEINAIAIGRADFVNTGASGEAADELKAWVRNERVRNQQSFGNWEFAVFWGQETKYHVSTPKYESREEALEGLKDWLRRPAERINSNERFSTDVPGQENRGGSTPLGLNDTTWGIWWQGAAERSQ
jgi:hypothetical protein